MLRPNKARSLKSALKNILFGLTFLAVLGLPFLFRPPTEASVGEKELVVLSVHTETIRREFERAFSEWTAKAQGYTVHIDWLDVGGTNEAIRYVDDQFRQSPEGIKIDMLFGGGLDPFLHFADEGLLERCHLPEEVLAPIPRSVAGGEVYDPQQRWFGTCLAGFGVMYDKAVLRFLNLPDPETWADLGRPRYFTWVSSADPRQSGSIYMAYEIMLQAYGWDRGWGELMRIGGNCREFSRQASQVSLDVSTGEAACGMAIDFYALRAIAEVGEDKLGFVLPKPLTVINPDCIGLLKGAPHRDLAELFIRFILSEEGQRLWILKPGVPGGPRKYALYRLPVIPALARRYGDKAAVRIDPFAFQETIPFDAEKKNVRRRIVSDLFGAAIIDTHDELAAAWDALRLLPDDDPRVRELLEPPVSEDELMELARTKWTDTDFRAATIAKWSHDAGLKYERLAGAN
jgi:ABC-type Fe3+ transport system substrate-binding protein